jgi:hypothetical protein
MKSIGFLLVILLVTNFWSCEPPVTFTEQQPINVANLSKFPKNALGQFVSLNDSSQLIVSENMIKRIYDYDFKMSTSDMDSALELVGDTLVNLITHEKAKVVVFGDSLQLHVHEIDTIFQMDDDNVLRKYKGYYFINKLYGKASWEVKKMDVSRNQLIISTINAETEIEGLKQMAENEVDTVLPYKFTISKKNFKTFVKNEGFKNNEIFIKKK